MPTLQEELLADPSISFWLKEQISRLNERDPVDAARDIELLHQVALERLKELKVITEPERETLVRASAEALASIRIEGGEVSDLQHELDQRLQRGEIDHQQAIDETISRYKKT